MAVWGSGAEPKQEAGEAYKGIVPAPVDPLAGKGRRSEFAKCHCAVRGSVFDG